MAKNNISVIIPVHALDERTEVLFKGAVESVHKQKVLPEELVIVTPKGSEAFDYVSKYKYPKELKITILENDGDTDFASQMNYGVANMNTDWFTMLEYDDELAIIWIDNLVKYRDAYPDVDIFLPMVVDVKETEKKNEVNFIGFTNEAVWAQSFSDEIGYLDNGALLAYQNFNIDGMCMTKDKYEEIGGIKSNMKLTFIYEFLLRATFQAAIVYVIPKLGYKHITQRLGSLFNTYKDEMTPMEANWWLESAKKEYFHPNDRELTYDE